MKKLYLIGLLIVSIAAHLPSKIYAGFGEYLAYTVAGAALGYIANSKWVKNKFLANSCALALPVSIPCASLLAGLFEGGVSTTCVNGVCKTYYGNGSVSTICVNGICKTITSGTMREVSQAVTSLDTSTMINTTGYLAAYSAGALLARSLDRKQ